MKYPVLKHDEAHGEETHEHWTGPMEQVFIEDHPEAGIHAGDRRPVPPSGLRHNHEKGTHGWFVNRELKPLPLSAKERVGTP